MRILVTGSAGFIGAHLCNRLTRDSRYQILGLDNFNDYYDVNLKHARVQHLAKDLEHLDLDITDLERVRSVMSELQPDVVVHLAAQAGVRYSFESPMSYAESNLMGQVSVLEAIRSTPSVKRLIYASSSSVYSGNEVIPFHEDLNLKTPKSLYAATKVAGEVLVDTYSSLHNIDAIGLRFFTVYGPWGRPDMAYWTFSESILRGNQLKLFNFGDLRRDFTYVDDITEAILKMVQEVSDDKFIEPSHRLYNIGNHSPVAVSDMISTLEKCLGVEAQVSLAPLPPGDMIETYANVDRLQSDYGFAPNTSLESGLANFVNWFRDWRNGNFYKLESDAG